VKEWLELGLPLVTVVIGSAPQRRSAPQQPDGEPATPQPGSSETPTTSEQQIKAHRRKK
jgi:hypothetical protein